MNLVLVIAIVMLSVISQQDDRLVILSDYGATVDDGITTAELQTAIAKMLPDAGSVIALKAKFQYIFEDQPDVVQSLAGDFDSYHKIESDPMLQMAEIERLRKAKEDHGLIEFWLDRLAIAGDAHIDRAEWYLKRDQHGDVQRAYDLYRKALSMGRNITTELKMLEGRLGQ